MRADELKHYDEDTLVHFGVKGMKWGVRKAERNARLAGRFETKAASSRSVMDSSQAKLDHYKTRQAKKVSSYNRQKLREWQAVNDRATKKTEKWEKHAQARREGRMDPTAKKYDSIYNSTSPTVYRYSTASKAKTLFDDQLAKERYRLIGNVSRTATGNRAIDKRIPKAVKKFEKVYGDRGIRTGYGR